MTMHVDKSPWCLAVLSQRLLKQGLIPLVGVSVLALLLALNVYFVWLVMTLPNTEKALQASPTTRSMSQFYAQDKSVLYAYGFPQPKFVPLDAISPVLVEMLLVVKDPDFYQHRGVLRWLRQAPASPSGGNTETLTQQLVRQTFGLPHKQSLTGQFRTRLLASKLETHFSKQQILARYLNTAYFGNGTYGIAAASQLYFAKPPHRLSTTESAFLVGLLQPPELPNPFLQPQVALKRRNQILQHMANMGKIPPEVTKLLASDPLGLNLAGQKLVWMNKAPTFNRYALKETLAILKTDEDTFWHQGFQVFTTLKPQNQLLADSHLSLWSRLNTGNAAPFRASLLSMEPTGRVVAYAGKPMELHAPYIPVKPYMIDKIMDRKGRVRYSHTATTQVTSNPPIPQGNTLTQTSQANSTQWFIGTLPDLMTVVWVDPVSVIRLPGYSRPVLPMDIWQGYISHFVPKTPKPAQSTWLASVPVPTSLKPNNPPPALKAQAPPQRSMHRTYRRSERKRQLAWRKQKRHAASVPRLTALPSSQSAASQASPSPTANIAVSSQPAPAQPLIRDYAYTSIQVSDEISLSHRKRLRRYWRRMKADGFDHRS